MLSVLDFHLLFLSNVNFVSWVLCKVVFCNNLLISASDVLINKIREKTDLISCPLVLGKSFEDLLMGRSKKEQWLSRKTWPGITKCVPLPFEASLAIIKNNYWHFFLIKGFQFHFLHRIVCNVSAFDWLHDWAEYW